MCCGERLFVVNFIMLHVMASLSALLHILKKCPKCGTVQHFKGKKKGDTVICKHCKYKFAIK